MNSPAECAPLAFLGGTFDPIHYGHLRLAEEARVALGGVPLWLVPAADPPLRDRLKTTATQRLEMVRLAIEGNAALGLSEVELQHAGKSYTVETLKRLRAFLGEQRPLVWVVGADAFLGFTHWHQWPLLFNLAHIAVANRAGVDWAPLAWQNGLPAELQAFCRDRVCVFPAGWQNKPAGCVIPFNMTPLDISATRVRALLGEGGSARYLLPDSVIHYALEHRLYSS